MSRWVEVVFRELAAPLGIALSASTSTYREGAETQIGPYKHTAETNPTRPSTLTHWAIRIQAWDTEEDNIQSENLPADWHYFGLSNNPNETPATPKLCNLDLSAWTSLGNEKNRLRGWTQKSLFEFKDVAETIMSGWGDYDFLGNNCQDYAIALFLQVVDGVEHQDRVLESLRSRSLISWIRIEEDSNGLMTVRDRQGKVVLTAYKAGQNPNVKAAVSTGQNENLKRNSWVWDARANNYWRMGKDEEKRLAYEKAHGALQWTQEERARQEAIDVQNRLWWS